MRSILASIALGTVLLVIGCNVLKPHPVGPGPGVIRDNALPQPEQLVQYLNRNADLIGPDDALKCTNLSILCKAGLQSVGLGGNMICQKPRNFRLMAKVLSQPTVDIGSNDREFWYWISKNNPPYLFHCSYEALKRGVNIPFPFQPDMVLTALGLAKYDESKKYELNAPPKAKYFELIENTTSPSGQPIQKVVVFNREQVDVPNPQVMAYVLRDGKGKPLCTATIKSVQRNRERGAILPQKLIFDWPAEKLRMTMELNGLQVVKMTPETAGRFFTRRNLGYPAYDLATRHLDNGALQRAGAVSQVRTR